MSTESIRKVECGQRGHCHQHRCENCFYRMQPSFFKPCADCSTGKRCGFVPRYAEVGITYTI